MIFSVLVEIEMINVLVFVILFIVQISPKKKLNSNFTACIKRIFYRRPFKSANAFELLLFLLLFCELFR